MVQKDNRGNFSVKVEDEAFRAFIIIYFIFRYEWLRSNVRLVPYKATIRSVMTYAAPRWNLRQAPRLWNCSGCTTKFSARLAFSKAHTEPWYICDFKNSIHVWFCHKIMLPESRCHTKWENENVRII